MRKFLLLLVLCAYPLPASAIHIERNPFTLEESVRASAIEKAKALIKSFESLGQKAYICPGGQITIGYGHADPKLKLGDRITVVQAEELLDKDMARFVDAIDTMVTVPLTDNQAAALACFAFNVGVGAFQRSTLRDLLNKGDYEGAANQFKRWNKSNGRVLAGLTSRRAAEAKLFRGEL